ncbi:hypothetical protein [Streptomyces cadmiisoli]|uniref:hypothetical protein n=1 Tax=Streptomyces cadmiisoli TaxID=2184053 RepID=UPI003D7128A6
MSPTSGSFSSAAAYAEGVVDGAVSSFRWSDLESSAFGRVPELREAAVAAGADLDRTRTGWDHALDAGWLVALFAPLALPVLTIFAVRDGDAAVALYGVIGLISAVHIVLRVREWRQTRAGRTRATAQEVVLALFEAVFAAVSAGVLAVAASVEPSLGRWSLCAGQVAVAVVCVVSVRVARQAASRGVPTAVRPAYEEFIARVAELDDDDRVAIQADLNCALDRLSDAGVISPAQLAEAHRAPLGSLVRRLWVLQQSPARQAR